MAHVILVGLPGVGKSTVGHAVADALGLAFLDLDVVIARQNDDETAAEVIAKRGMDVFRDLEAACLRLVLAEPAVVSTGGGVVERFENRQALRQHGKVLWLDCGDDEILPRVMGSDRPLLAIDPRDTLAALRQSREVLYQEIATSRINSSGMLPDVVDSVRAVMSGWTS